MTPAKENCAEYDQLWEDYIQAVTAHLKIVALRHQAVLHSAALNEAEVVEGDLIQCRLKACRAVVDHEAEHEPV